MQLAVEYPWRKLTMTQTYSRNSSTALCETCVASQRSLDVYNLLT